MDIIICAALVIIAICLANGRPINIQITHKHEIDKDTTTAPEIEDQQPLSMDGAIKVINEVMGVFNDEE